MKPSLSFAALIVLILLAAVIAIYFDDMPAQPKCEANELAILNSGVWYCFQVRKP